MKPRTMVLLVVAIGFGLVAAWLTSQLGARPQDDKVQVLVAKGELHQGTLIDDPSQYFVYMGYDKANVTPNHLTDLEKLKGKIVARNLSEKQPVMTADITDKIGPNIPVGKLAMSIRVDVEKAVAGFVMPRSRVDILLTRRLPSGQVKASPVLENMEVLAVDQHQQAPEGSTAIIPTTVTLIVDRDEGERLAEAREMGTLALLLRAFNDGSKGAVKKAEEEVQVLVAQQEIGPDTTIDEPGLWFVPKSIPKSQAPAGYVWEIKDLQGRMTNKRIALDQVITYEDIVTKVADKVVPVVAPPPPKPKEKHTLVIINGSADPQTFEFEKKSNGGTDNRTPRQSPPSLPPSDGKN